MYITCGVVAAVTLIRSPNAALSTLFGGHQTPF